MAGDVNATRVCDHAKALETSKLYRYYTKPKDFCDFHWQWDFLSPGTRWLLQDISQHLRVVHRAVALVRAQETLRGDRHMELAWFQSGSVVAEIVEPPLTRHKITGGFA